MLILGGLLAQTVVVCLHQLAGPPTCPIVDGLLWLPLASVFSLGVVATRWGSGSGTGALLGVPFVVNSIALTYLIVPHVCTECLGQATLGAHWRSLWMDVLDWLLMGLLYSTLGVIGVIVGRLMTQLARTAA